MYSLMSIWISASSSPNMNSASALASSVLPTPVGPAKMKQPVGRFGSFNPLRLRRTALAIALDRLVLADDPLVQLVFHLHQPQRCLRCVMRVSGMPVILETTSAITSSSTTPSASRDLSRQSRVIVCFFFFSLSA